MGEHLRLCTGQRMTERLDECAVSRITPLLLRHMATTIPPCSQAEGLIPKWLAFTLTQQPALFDRAFQRCFAKVGEEGAQLHPLCGVFLSFQINSCLEFVTSLCPAPAPTPPQAAAATPPKTVQLSRLPQELELSQQEGEEADDPMAWACQRFWKRRAAPLPLSRSLGRLRRWGWWAVGNAGGRWSVRVVVTPTARATWTPLIIAPSFLQCPAPQPVGPAVRRRGAPALLPL